MSHSLFCIKEYTNKQDSFLLFFFGDLNRPFIVDVSTFSDTLWSSFLCRPYRRLAPFNGVSLAPLNGVQYTIYEKYSVLVRYGCRLLHFYILIRFLKRSIRRSSVSATRRSTLHIFTVHINILRPEGPSRQDV